MVEQKCEIENMLIIVCETHAASYTDIIVFKQTRAIAKRTIFKAKTEAWHNCRSINHNTKLSETWCTLKEFSSQELSYSIPTLKMNGKVEKLNKKKLIFSDQYFS